MLRERTFQIGGGLLLAFGVVLLLAIAWAGGSSELFGVAETGTILIGFGIFFWFVGRGARKARRKLLSLGEASGEPAPPPN